MIRDSLIEEKIDISSIYLIPVPDILMNSTWVYHLKTFSPQFDIVIARNPLVIRLFKEAGYEVLQPPAYDREKYNSTLIRRLVIEKNEEWKKLVPQKVVEYILKIRGEERLRAIAGIY